METVLSKGSECQHGPPGKQQHFAATDNCLRFRDSNGVWYRGRITAFDEKTAKRIVYFANDGEQPTCTRTCTRTCTHIGHTYIDITYCHMVAKDNQALKNTGHHHTVCEVGEVKGSGGKYRLCSQLTLAHYCWVALFQPHRPLGLHIRQHKQCDIMQMMYAPS